jgi:hypothetical protein
MALPVMNTPKYSVIVPSTGQEIEYRPFLVKEEKIMLTALEGGDQKGIVRAVLDVIEKCVLTEGVDIRNLPTFDVEKIFLKIRAKSVGETIEMRVRHPKGECEHRTDVIIPLEDINVSGKIQDGKIELTDTVGIKLKYPSFETSYGVGKLGVKEAFDIIYDSIEYVWDENDVYRDFDKEEMENWVGQLTKEQFKMIMDFLENSPKMKYDIQWTCKECGKEDSVVVEGLTSFFTSG